MEVDYNRPATVTAEKEKKVIPVHKITEDEITTLNGHSAEVFTCAWNPGELLLATGYINRISLLTFVEPETHQHVFGTCLCTRTYQPRA